MCDNYDVSFLPEGQKPTEVVFSCDSAQFKMSKGEQIKIGDITYNVNLTYNDTVYNEILLLFSIDEVGINEDNDITVSVSIKRLINNYPKGKDTTSIPDYINLLKPDFLKKLKYPWHSRLNEFIVNGLNAATQGEGQEGQEEEDEEEEGGGKKKSKKRIRKSRRKKSRKHRKSRKSRKSKRRY
jgi:hypothetical protein